jgi:(+)-neomenthol dehydrogenase
MEGSFSSSSEQRVAVVTGGNKGIGLEICKQLASSGITVVLTARDEKRGTAAVDALRELGLSDVMFHQLDISEPSSAARLADFVKDKFGKLDILVNNAAILGVTVDVGDPDPAAVQEVISSEKFTSMSATEKLEWVDKRSTETYAEAEECLRTNYGGTKNVTEALLPLLLSSSDARVVNLSSFIALLRVFSGELKQELNDIDKLSVERVDELSELFLEDFKNGQLDQRGWPIEKGPSAYRVSKALVNAYTRVLAKKHASLRINCVNPGHVNTDGNYHTGDLTVAEGARGPVTVALAPREGPTGAYFDGTEEASFV